MRRRKILMMWHSLHKQERSSLSKAHDLRNNWGHKNITYGQIKDAADMDMKGKPRLGKLTGGQFADIMKYLPCN